MTSFTSIQDGQSADALIGMYDINGFTRISRTQTAEQTFKLVQDVGAMASRAVAAADGLLIKYIGDAALFAFPDEIADEAMSALFGLKENLEQLLRDHGHDTSLTFSLHFGSVVFGKIPPIENWDIMGHAVNLLWTLDRGAGRGQFVISPQAFRKLGKANRTRFHKHTPPVVYVSARGDDG